MTTTTDTATTTETAPPPTTTEAPAPTAGAVLDRAWGVAPQVSVRPEAFGALLYHFGTRRLSFLKDPRLLAALQHLDAAPSARAACTEAGVTESELPAFARALDRLARTDMIRPREEDAA